MNMNRFLFILCLLLSFAGGDSVIQAADPWNYPTSKPETPFGGGDGSSWNPYRIETAQHLANLAYMVTKKGTTYKGKYFVMTNDITLNDDVIGSDGKSLQKAVGKYASWIPIGDSGILGGNAFEGNFDGQGHTIKGMVRNNQDEEAYNGLFGNVKNAVIQDINMVDCYIECGYNTSPSATYGILVAKSMNSTYMNCTVTNSVIRVGTENDVAIGGILGNADADGECKTRISNCKFNGYIRLCVEFNRPTNPSMRVGGIMGNEANSREALYMSNCSTSGDIEFESKVYISRGAVGGIAANFANQGSVNNCVSSMNITINSPYNRLSKCFVGGICCDGFNKTKDDEINLTLNNCVYLGTIRIGSANNKAKMQYLHACGIGNNRAWVNSCAFYGKFDIHSEGATEVYIAPIVNKYYMGNLDLSTQYKQSVVYSVGNVIDIESSDLNIDQVCNLMTEGKLHKDYYHFETSDGRNIECKYSDNTSTYHKTLAQLKADGFVSALNSNVGSNIWGKLTGMSDESLNDLPMPVACGGVPASYTGGGTLDNPYMINTKDDLNRLKDYVNGGRAFENTYFKLGADISITGTLSECIGTYEKPFKGHFDGNGHAIVGLHKSLFGYMYGTVKNLALVDCDIWQGNYATALARQVGDTDNKAEVSNCYVSGTISFSTPWDQLGYASTFAFQVAKGSSIHDCYFKGRFVVKQQTFNTYNVAGIAIYDNNREVNTSAVSPVGIFNCYASFDVKVEASVWQTRYTYGISSESSNDESKGNYFVCSDNGVHQSNNGGIKLNSESELNGKFKDKSGWLQGVYRPLLASAKHYEATSPEGTTAYFDAIPEANPKKNYIYNVTVSGDPYADKTIWQLPNMAVYVPSEQTDYITNGYLDQSADFQYNRTANATKGQLRYDLKQNASGYHIICLPGVVERGDLPKDGKVMIYGKITTTETSQEINEVHVDTIPAGVPCILYVPTAAYAEGTDIPLVMRGEIRIEPLIDANYSNMKGTFKTVTNVNDACITATKREDGNVYFEKSASAVTLQPFTAWLEGATGDVKIVDYVLLDEENEAMTVTLANLNEQTINLKMRRTVKGGKWNTLCLPFDMTAEEIAATFGEGTKVEEFSSLTYDSSKESTTLQFSKAETITAGTPYLLKPGRDTDASIFDIKSKEIKCESETFVPEGTTNADAANTVSLTMQGEYNHRMISSNDYAEKNMYVISGDKIYYVDSDVEMKGFRCYFVAEETASGSGAKLFSGARLMHFDGSSTELRLIKAEAEGEDGAVYDLLGRKSNGQTNGVVIKNGKKVLKN